VTDRNLVKPIWLALALIATPCLLLFGLEAYQAIRTVPELTRNQELVAHTVKIISAAHNLDAAIQDAERGQRGFLITEDAEYLNPYATGVELTPDLLATLHKLTADNPDQQRRLGQLADQIAIKFDEMKRTIEARRNGGFDAARRIVATNVGFNAMRAITRLIGEVIETENTLLAQRLAHGTEAERTVANGSLIGGALALSTMLLGFVLVTRNFNRISRSEAMLRESEGRFNLLVSGIRDTAMCLLNPQGHVSSWNAGAERLNGYRSDDIIGQHFSVFFTDDDRASEKLALALETTSHRGHFEEEGWCVRKDGSRFWASVTMDAIHDDRGQIIGFAKITRDMSERRRLQDLVNQAREQLFQSQKMEAVGQLTGGVAHDFNNLLMIVVGNLEIAQRNLASLNGAVEAQMRRVINNAMHGAKRSVGLTQRLLAFFRRQPLDPKPLDVNKFIAGAADFLQRSIGETVDVQAVGGGGVWQIEVDTVQLESVLLNLAVNARDAMPNGGKLTIETSNVYLDQDYCRAHPEVRPGQYVLIAITDNGAGMTNEVLERAFEPFFTTKAIGEGTGLGLSQVYGFVKQSGGHLKLYSEPGEGTTVKIYLPRLPGNISQVETMRSEVVPGNGGETVLVVEDDSDVRAYVVETLRDLNYQVLEAPNAAFAIAMIEGMEHRLAANRRGAARPERPAVGRAGAESTAWDQGFVHDRLFAECHRSSRSARCRRRVDPEADLAG
jgi:PAS domain S-box-containing protein